MLFLVKNVVPSMLLNSSKKKLKNNLIVPKQKLLDSNNELLKYYIYVNNLKWILNKEKKSFNDFKEKKTNFICLGSLHPMSHYLITITNLNNKHPLITTF